MRRHKNDTRPSAVATAGEGPTELVAAYKKMFDKCARSYISRAQSAGIISVRVFFSIIT